jgi:endonuclease YncB( thermonuclease family)
MRNWGVGLAIHLVILAWPAGAETLLGPARVVDGDTVEVAGRKVRFLGIDAPELAQTCVGADGSETACGQVSARSLAGLIAGRDLLCEGSDTDVDGRLLARCNAGSGDLGRLMVLEGQAVVFVKFSREYATEQDLARKAGRGLWAGQFELPWDYRAARRHVVVQAAPHPDCPIKGNISRKGERIYHLPADRDYLKTRIDAAKGERWFCSEAEAVHAGWRPARR